MNLSDRFIVSSIRNESGIMLNFFLFWIVLSVLVSIFANNKGRSGISFFFISLLLSPVIGFIIPVVISPIREKVAEKSGLKKCSECAEYVQGEARVCRFCGHKFPESPESPQSLEERAEELRILHAMDRSFLNRHRQE